MKQWLIVVLFVCLLGGCIPRQVPPTQQLPRITIAFLELSPIPPEIELVETEINRRFGDNFGFEIHLLPVASGLWEQQVNFLLASGAPPDLLVVSGPAFINRVSRGQLSPLDALLAAHGQGIVRTLDPVYLRAGSLGDTLYSIPSIRDLASNYGVLLRSDVLARHHIDPSIIHNLSELEKVLLQVHQREGLMIPLLIEHGAISPLIFNNLYDGLGDDIGILPDLKGGKTLTNLFDSAAYARIIRMVHEWYQQGLLLKDGATNQESIEDLLKSGQVFAALYHQKPGFAEQESRISGHPLVAVSLTPAVATSDKVINVMWAIPSGSQFPDLAMKFLNQMYINPGLVNLLDWGIEGRHYIKQPDGTITFPPGVDADNSAYNPNHGWLFGNQFLSWVFSGDDPDLWEKTARFNRQAIKSPVLGFNFNPEPVKTDYAAVNAVLAEYRFGLECGVLDPDIVLPLFRSQLHNAGIARVIAEKQRQLDQWLRHRSE